MDIQEAIQIIEESPDYEQFKKLKNIFRDRLEELDKNDFTERGVCYYYLLRIILRSQVNYETEECRDSFIDMRHEFSKQLRKYKKDGKRFDKQEIGDFFHLAERCFGSLEIIFRHKDFFEEERRAFEEKMDYRLAKYRMSGKWFKWLEYSFLGGTSRYGNSFVRWGGTAFVFAMIMAVVYYILDVTHLDGATRMIAEGSHWYDYVYFSIVTLTSLGFGDITPHTFIGKFFVSVEVFFGFIMLGIFISLIQKKM